MAGCSNQKPTVATTTTITTMPAQTWVNQVCTALEANFNAINSATDGYKAGFNSKELLTTAQQNLVSFLNQVQSAYQSLVTQINSLKPPSVKGGLKAFATIQMAVKDAYDSVNAAIVLAQNLPIDNVANFHSSASQLSLLLKDALTKTDSIINQVQNGKTSQVLAVLFSKNQNCPS